MVNILVLVSLYFTLKENNKSNNSNIPNILYNMGTIN